MRYSIVGGFDDDYIVPVEKIEEWYSLVEKTANPFWIPPTWARRVEGFLTFENPKLTRDEHEKVE